MPWVRIDENAMEHPKIGGLPDGAFRLWVTGLAYCQKFLTDGYISQQALRGLRAYSPKRKVELVRAGLWNESETGIHVHDFLDWNESREHVLAARNYAKERMQKLRRSSREHPKNEQRTNADVPSGWVGTGSSALGERGVGENPDGEPFDSFAPPGDPSDPALRAGEFVIRYKALYRRLRKVEYVGKPHFDFEEAAQLVGVFDDPTLDKLAYVWLKTDHPFAENGTRTLAKFRSYATWCQEQLNAWEAKHGRELVVNQ
jgi:hypothetical protein